MRTAWNITLILLAGVGLGLMIRPYLKQTDVEQPGPGDVVFRNDGSDIKDDPDALSNIQNPDPSHPPEDEEWLSRFELIERNGQLVKSEQLLGQPYVVSFFFSTCPSICVQQNQKLKELQDAFQGEEVRFVAISVDPETDTPEVLTEYAARFGADAEQWLFMTGDLTYIRRIGGEIFKQPVNKQFHTERFVLVDPEGKIEGFYNWPDKPQFEKLQEKIREMINGGKS
ncbi:MAG: SCO family protein [Rubripirellula sp.]|nr:copper transporter [Rhodopirellula sp.]MCH1441444.1 SCO family protein [Rubripirellula sp.]OUX05381.1 MAG: copper transporter [Planctomycetaceae bacterium TMED240]